MHRGIAIFSLALVAALVAYPFAASQPPSQEARKAMWKKVDEAVQKGLPKSAIEQLQVIAQGALNDRAYPEAIAAIGKRIALDATIEGGSPAERIGRMKKDLEAAPAEMKPAIHALLANWYWAYFQENRWQFSQRSATENAPGDDPTTWDLRRIFDEIDSHYSAALAEPQVLQSVPIATYDALLEKGTLPDAYRPTLYDFLAFQAIDFYTVGEQAGAARQNAFEIEASSPIFGSIDEFIAWKPETKDVDAPKLKAIELYQQLLTFHRQDEDPSALLDANLGRLQLGYNHAVGEEKVSRTKVALKALADTYAMNPLSATARHRLAEILMSEENPTEAREVALQGKNAHPQSVGGLLCQNLIVTIESKSIAITTERVWSEPLPVLRVQYRNIDKVHFRAIKSDWRSRLTSDRWNPSQMTQADIDSLASEKPALAWSADLPPTDDYLEATEDVPAPTTLAPGYYLILSSMLENFRDPSNQIHVTEVWVTKLALVMRQQWGRGKASGFVLDNRTGEPIAGANVQIVYRERSNNGFVDGPKMETDKDGMFEFPSENRGSFAWVRHNGQSLATQSEYSTYTQQTPAINTHMALFTDRSIYRPGQMVQVKGIAMITDSATNRYQVVAGKPFRVHFRDTNGEDIETIDVRSNDYGSFATTFTAPRNRGTGAMSITVDDVVQGQTPVRVEEYKRPKFKVDVELPKDAIKLSEVVKVTGKAMSYTGAPVQGAKVRYRVVRQVRWPDWFMFCYGWRIAPIQQNALEITSGWAETQPDGSFALEFTAIPDRSVPESDQPIFTYSVTADVTDGTGETRTGENSVSVAYTALQANMSAEDWQTQQQPVKVQLRTTNTNGLATAASGTVRVHALREPESVLRPDILGQRVIRPNRGPNRGRRPSRPPVTVSQPVTVPDPSDYRNWPLGDEVAREDFATGDEGKAELEFELKRGLYRVVLETQDRFGKPVRSEVNLRVLDPTAKELGMKLAHVFAAEKATVQPGDNWSAILGSGYDSMRAYVEIEHRGKLLQKYWTTKGPTQFTIAQKVDETMRGGFTVRITTVRENRLYTEARTIDIPWTNKELTVRWDRFRSKLEPGSKESWSLTITGPDATAAVAEMVAGMYDASLDAYLPHSWISRISGFYHESSPMTTAFENQPVGFQWLRGTMNLDLNSVVATYRHFPADLQMALNNRFAFARGLSRGGMGGAPMPASAMFAAQSHVENAEVMEKSVQMDAIGGEAIDASVGGGAGRNSPGPQLDSVSPRKNLNETAFFFPMLRSDADGTVRLEFTMPEALTTWRFLSFAHDQELRSGGLVDQVITAKDLMVQPNPPRFLREGDTLEFSVKVTNQGTSSQTGKVVLRLSDAISEASVDAEFGNMANELEFALEPNSSKTYRWKLKVPDGARPIIYKAIAATEKLSDGEQGMLPVLSNRILVTESLPLPIRGQGTKKFALQKLIDSAGSETIRNQSLTVQMTSQPAWYAVLALPYLMEYPYECSEQTFNRLYANALARHIAQSDPKIARVFEVWRETQPDALVSPLSKNEDLKSVMIEETPWLRSANRESQSRRNVGILFDNNRLDAEVARTLQQLAQMQQSNGMWPWFPGGRDNEYLSLYIVTGFGRLRHLGAKIDESIALKALDRLDAWMHEMYDRIRAADREKEKNHLSPIVAMYLYGRSFFLTDRPIAEQHQVALRFWQDQASEHWLKLSRQSQGHIAIGLKRMGIANTPDAIVKSLRENSVSNEEMGMFWRDAERSWWWYRAPIETQAMMIEVFDEVAQDAEAVEGCKVWLLKQKQTQDWKTTKATADAVYGLLRRGENWLASDALVSVTVADMTIVPEAVEAGTGFYEQTFVRNEILPEMGNVSVTKKDAGVSWGSIHWQYLEDISKVTPYDGTPLKLEKRIYRRVFKETGPVLEEVAGPIAVGDELVCRIVLRCDRDMEYVHLKDQRGSGTEPVNVLSSYRAQDGLFYYESTRDTATHFFIDYLRKGNYVFEYTLRVQHAGRYPTGLATIQCMYAPEFNGHSESIPLIVE